MKYTLNSINLNKPNFDALVVNIFKDDPVKTGFHGLDQVTCQLIQQVLDKKDFKPKSGELFELYPLSSYPFRILLVGSGKKVEFNKNIARENGGAALKYLKSKKVKTVAFDFEGVAGAESVQALVEGIELASFNHEIFKKKEDQVDISRVFLNLDLSLVPIQQAIKTGQLIGESTNWARDLEFKPSNHITPSILVKEARKLAAELKLDIEVYDETQARKMGMGGFSAMAQGSDEPSFMVLLKYYGDPKKKETVGLVGKGITFDSGGISIKPSKAMPDMKMDMCGAANVMAIVRIVASLKLPLNIVAALPITENMPSGKAIKPGDVVTALNGKTIEITNTDAEGRVVMSDALVLVQREGAHKILEFSTLTGAVLAALGDITTAVLGNNQNLVDNILQISKEEDEPMWQLPMDDRYKDLIKSHIADMVNGEGAGKIKGAGPIAGAIFLQEFIEDGTQFIHFDIAGTAWGNGNAYLTHGPTGVGIRTAVAFLKKLT